MSQSSATKAKRVLAALLRIGWIVKRESSSHKILHRPGLAGCGRAFQDIDELEPKRLARTSQNKGAPD